MECVHPCVYVCCVNTFCSYEIHLCADVRHKGLGKFLMQILELIGHKANMQKLMLTVFKENTISSQFFREKMKYSEDETSPLYCDPLHAEDYTYCILSKRLTRPAQKPVRTSAKTSRLEQETTDQPSTTSSAT